MKSKSSSKIRGFTADSSHRQYTDSRAYCMTKIYIFAKVVTMLVEGDSKSVQVDGYGEKGECGIMERWKRGREVGPG